MENSAVVKSDDKYQIDEELLLRQVTELVLKERLLSGKTLSEDRVVNFVHSEKLQVPIFKYQNTFFLCSFSKIFHNLLFIAKELVDFSLGGTGLGHAQILELCKQAVEYSVRTNHPKFLNQLYHGADPVGLAGSWLSEALNTNM